MSVLPYLQKARELLDSPNSWIKGDFAQDKDGNSVWPRSPSACRWCLIGAFWHVADGDRFMEKNVIDVFGRVLPPGQDESVFCFNDDPNTTHDDVLQLLDKAIAVEIGER